MMQNNVINQIKNKDLCIGCGICVNLCPNKNLFIDFNEYGNYSVFDRNNCLEKCDLCLQVCSFATAKYSKNEETIAKQVFLEEQDFDEYLGFYKDLIVGHLNNDEQRLNSSSGGIAKTLLHQLLEKNIVDKVINVIPNNNPEKLFKFSVADTAEELKKSAKSVYYPVEMSEIIQYILDNDGSYVITALPCFAKALRSAQNVNKKLKDRIKFIFGLTCGQTKSKYFLKYISHLGGISQDINIKSVDFRQKDSNFGANNFFFNITDENLVEHKIYFKEKIDNIWNNRWFTPNSCNFCDDVFAELADISFMDAWLDEYKTDWRGHSIIICRSQILSALLKELAKENIISIKNIEKEKVIKSQMNRIKNKREILSWRLYKNKNLINKRTKPEKPKLLDFAYFSMVLKDKIRAKSFEYFPEILQNQFLQKELKKYEKYTKHFDFCQRIINKFRKKG